MGLDTIEFIMAIEEEFEISIPDEDAVWLTTPQKAALFVAETLNINNQNYEKYLLQKKFYRLRKFLTDEFNIKRLSLKPSTLIIDILPKQNIQIEWNKLNHFVADGRLENLKCSSSIQKYSSIIFWMTAISSTLLLLYSNFIFDQFQSSFFRFITVISIVIVFSALYTTKESIQRKLANEIPKDLDTIEKLTHYVILPIKKDEVLTFEMILHRIIMILNQSFQIPINQINPNSSIVDDLHLS